MDLYEEEMPPDLRHLREDIVQWLIDDKQTGIKNAKSPEILIIAKRREKVSVILFATYHYDVCLLNIYALARAPIKSSAYDGQALTKVAKKLAKIVKRYFPECIGMLIEVNNTSKRDKARLRLFPQYVRQCKTRLHQIDVPYLMPDLTGSGNTSNERPLALLFAPSPWKQETIDIKNQSVINSLVRSIYFGIYASCFTDDPVRKANYISYLENLANRVLG